MSLPEGTRSDAPPPAEDRTYATGDRCEKYRIVRLLGEGGMGQVYVAEDEYLGRRVALKVVRRKYMQGGGFAQGQRKEARVLAELDHPAIVKVYDAGITRGGVMYIVMELIEGISLRELIFRAGALDLPSALSIAAQIADAVRVAHRAGIVHRDLKPENALVTRAGLVKVVDFGIAKRIRRQPAGHTSSDPFANIGTVHYMAPEQMLGDGATKASDVYAIGMILYEMIAGRHTFAATSHEVPTAGEVMLHQVHAVPTPLVEAVPGFDAREISDLVGRMLSKLPRERPRAAEVQRALARAVRRYREEHPRDEGRIPLAAEHRRDPPIAPQPRNRQASWAELDAGAARGAGGGPESTDEHAAWPGPDGAPHVPQFGTAPLAAAFRAPEAALPFRPAGAAPPELRGRGWTARMPGAPGPAGAGVATAMAGPAAAVGAPTPEQAAAGAAAAPTPEQPAADAAAGAWVPATGVAPTPHGTLPWEQPATVAPTTAPLLDARGMPTGAPGPGAYAPEATGRAGFSTAPLGGSAGARASAPHAATAATDPNPWARSFEGPAPSTAPLRPAELSAAPSGAPPWAGAGLPGSMPAQPSMPAQSTMPAQPSMPPQSVELGAASSGGSPWAGTALTQGIPSGSIGLGPPPIDRRRRARLGWAAAVACSLALGLSAGLVLVWRSPRDVAAPAPVATEPEERRIVTVSPPEGASSAGAPAPPSSVEPLEEPAQPPTVGPAAGGAASPAADGSARPAASAQEAATTPPPATPDAPHVAAEPPTSPAPAQPRSALAAPQPRPAAAAPQPRATPGAKGARPPVTVLEKDDDIYGMPAPDRRRAAPPPPARKAPARPF
ncbi:protein kinase domain-containing protein [Sorangium sp. So ce124]|uniref:serine/threonine-protein kinase n=1 Tax=Sorangium sp. So ce124 TaxID=3133280 RepID=UPI003F5FC198